MELKHGGTWIRPFHILQNRTNVASTVMKSLESPEHNIVLGDGIVKRDAETYTTLSAIDVWVALIFVSCKVGPGAALDA